MSTAHLSSMRSPGTVLRVSSTCVCLCVGWWAICLMEVHLVPCYLDMHTDAHPCTCQPSTLQHCVPALNPTPAHTLVGPPCEAALTMAAVAVAIPLIRCAHTRARWRKGVGQEDTEATPKA